MPFEDLVRDDHIVLRLDPFGDAQREAIKGAYRKICRGHIFEGFSWNLDPHEDKIIVYLELKPKPPDKIWHAANQTVTLKAENLYGAADFDAMLAALEPYDLIDLFGADLPIIAGG